MDVSFIMVGHRPWAARMVESVRAHHPKARIVQMSDEATPCIADEVVRLPFDGKLMNFRLDHLANFAHEEMLILDDDCVVHGDLSHVFAHHFDVALTRRSGRIWSADRINVVDLMPYNTGVMFSRSQKFWQECAQEVRKLDDYHQRWWGDQMTVAALARSGTFSIHELSCDRYNWAPPAPESRSEALVWHYKGPRKTWLH